METMKERRFFDSAPELRADDNTENKRLVSGYAAVIGKRSRVLYWFTESIAPGAFDGCDMSDVVAYFNHGGQEDWPLARLYNGEGSLAVTLDDTGLKYEFEAPESSVGENLIVALKRKDIRHSSFAFTVKEDKWDYEANEDGTDHRTILKIDKIYDVSPVVNPAYLDTMVSARGMEQREEYLKELRKKEGHSRGHLKAWLELKKRTK